MPLPLLYDDLLCFNSGNNVQLSIYDARRREPRVDTERLEGLFGRCASPMGAAGRVDGVGRDGGTWVLRQGPQLEVLAKN